MDFREEHLILRASPALAAEIRQLIRDQDDDRHQSIFISADKPETNTDGVDTKRPMYLRIGDKRYAGRLVDLPCVVESLREEPMPDRKSYVKMANISQMFIVDEDNVLTKSEKERLSNTTAFHSGLTAPTYEIRKRWQLHEQNILSDYRVLHQLLLERFLAYSTNDSQEERVEIVEEDIHTEDEAAASADTATAEGAVERSVPAENVDTGAGVGALNPPSISQRTQETPSQASPPPAASPTDSTTSQSVASTAQLRADTSMATISSMASMADQRRLPDSLSSSAFPSSPMVATTSAAQMSSSTAAEPAQNANSAKIQELRSQIASVEAKLAHLEEEIRVKTSEYQRIPNPMLRQRRTAEGLKPYLERKEKLTAELSSFKSELESLTS